MTIFAGPGKGDLIKVTLLLGDTCQRRSSKPLATTYTYVEVDFSKEAIEISNELMDFQNDGSFLLSNRASTRFEEPFQKYLAEDDKQNEKLKRNRPQINQSSGMQGFSGDVKSEPMRDHRPTTTKASTFSPLEIGMYVLLGIFCIAIVIFVVNCLVFATRYRRKRIPNSETISDAPDWVYVGRATLERQSVNLDCSQTLVRQSDFNGNAMESDLGDASETTSNNNSNRNSTHSYQGSEISIRLTPNPHPSCRDDVQWDYEAMGLTYDQLKDYFDNLKESNA